MAIEKNRAESYRWMQSALDDMKTAAILNNAGQYAHCCFHSQQAAEKALKSVMYCFDGDVWGHSVVKLLRQTKKEQFISIPDDSELFDHALVLDRFYIPTRYPNGLPELFTHEAYSASDAMLAIKYSGEILELAEKTTGVA
jgi:HEPN domain-containing protein